MTPDTTGGPAFPWPDPEQNSGAVGMTLRDWFAGQALSGFLANPEQDYAPLIADKTPMLARKAYLLADAMLKAR
jgi:hypothetical protein